ncbi:hypothetical protein Ga0080559_TMP4491 [Salipiger profundus]|uniref:Uncharacterized protein n=1 Tax=Salipiger profundus TaxID=1229727 RepID=A0A1U7DAT2_9RHOB|nr:hypothetical protein Ga0080559_TMP4491 [Salipiger profundus]
MTGAVPKGAALVASGGETPGQGLRSGRESAFDLNHAKI